MEKGDMNPKWLNAVRIQNFKSIKDCSFEPKRINVLIGEPNSGKSNVLEALSLLGSTYGLRSGFFRSEIRYNDPIELFYALDSRKNVNVLTNLGRVKLEKHLVNGLINYKYSIISSPNDQFKQKSLDAWDNQIQRIFPTQKILDGVSKTTWNANKVRDGLTFAPVKFYRYKQLEVVSKNLEAPFLYPPRGTNFFTLAEKPGGIKKLFGIFLEKYLEKGCSIDLRRDHREIAIFTPIDEGVNISLNFNLQADTIQKQVFYHAAIATNRDSVLLFEEPEAHSYPLYVEDLATWIRADESNNQYFVATHSPYFLNALLFDSPQDVAVFLTVHDDAKGTQLIDLNTEQLRYVASDPETIFYNLDNLIKIGEEQGNGPR